MNNIANYSQPIMNKSFKKWLIIILSLCVFEALLFYLVFRFNWIPVLSFVRDVLDSVFYNEKRAQVGVILFFFFLFCLYLFVRADIETRVILFVPFWSVILLLAIRFWWSHFAKILSVTDCHLNALGKNAITLQLIFQRSRGLLFWSFSGQYRLCKSGIKIQRKNKKNHPKKHQKNLIKYRFLALFLLTFFPKNLILNLWFGQITES